MKIVTKSNYVHGRARRGGGYYKQTTRIVPGKGSALGVVTGTYLVGGAVGSLIKGIANAKPTEHKYVAFDEHDYKFKLDKLDDRLHRQHSIEYFEQRVKNEQKEEIKDLASLGFWLIILLGLITLPFVLILL